MKKLDFIKILAMGILVIVIGAWAQEDASVYVITPGTNSRFNATKNSGSFQTNQYIQTLINAIRTDASGGNVTIQFGNGQSLLDIDDESITFSGNWGNGKITLSGKLGSYVYGNNQTLIQGVITISDNISLDSEVDITNNSASGYYASILHNSTGILNIIDGNITAGNGNTNARTVYNQSSGTINITGGTITAKGNNGVAVYNNSSGTVKISGGTITVTNVTNMTNIRAVSNNGSNGKIDISGGNISAPDYAVHNQSSGTINISGGDISATDSSQPYVVNNAGSGTINIIGGDISATNSNNPRVINNSNSGTINIIGGTINSPLNSSAYAVYTNSTSNPLVLGGTPNITGTIRISNNSTSGGLSVITEEENKFIPDDKVYTLVLSSYSNGNVAVNNGAAFYTNFEFYNQPSNSVAIKGNNLVTATSTNVKTVTFETDDPYSIPVISDATIDKILKPSGFSKTGYISVNKWFSSDENEFVFGGEENIDDGILATTVNEDITLTLGYRAANVSITTNALASGTYNAAYSATVSASIEENAGGNIGYGLASGALPDGLTLASTGTISGIPAQSGSFTFKIKATNTASGAIDTKEFTISVNKAATTGVTRIEHVVAGYAHNYHFDLTMLLPSAAGLTDDVTYSPVITKDTNDILGALSHTGNTLTIPVNNVSGAGLSATITVTISSHNYANFTSLITVETVSKKLLNITGVTIADRVYNGNPHNYTGELVLILDDNSQTVTGVTLEVLYESTDGKGYNNATAPTNAGEYRLTIKVPDSDAVYIGDWEREFTIAKADPATTAAYAILTNPTALVGQTLADVTLPSGWSWVTVTTPVGDAGVRTHKAKFTPSDTANYKVLNNIDVTVTVSAPVSISKPEKSVNGSGVIFKNSVISDKLEIVKVVLPDGKEGKTASVIIYDNTGNVVYSGTDTKWDLRNKSGRTVANGGYLVIVEARDGNENVYYYSAKVVVNVKK